MFQETLFESNHSARSKTATMVAFFLQFAAVALVLVVPLLHIAAPPQVRLITGALSFAAPPPSPAPATNHVQAAQSGYSELLNERVLLPQVIPVHPAQIHDDNIAPPSPFASGDGVLGGTGTSTGHNVAELLARTDANVVRPPVVPTHPVAVSTGVMQGFLLKRVQPAYPALAQAARIGGTVVLSATITREGAIENLQVISGHPMLVGAAVDAVRHWRYRPYRLNGQPVEVETQIVVNFTITGS